ncbi:HU family DNA-binding protein [Vibrio mimicus]
MNKSELIMKVAEDADISKAKAEAAVNSAVFMERTSERHATRWWRTAC